MMVVGLRHMGNPLCYNPSLSGLGGASRVKRNMRNCLSYVAYLMFSAVENQRTVLPSWGRSVASFYSWANECCVTTVRLKEKNFMWKADQREVSILLGKAILQH